MNLLDVVLIGVALSMDACALTVANCATYRGRLSRAKSLSMPIAFAVFQGIMPLIGYFIGSTFSGYLEKYAGYLVAAVFFVLATKIVFDILKERKKKDTDNKAPTAEFKFGVLILQAIATSIDALLIGITLSLNLTFSIFWAVILIAGITFLLVIISLILGNVLGKVLGKYAEWAGALILSGLAIKNLIEAIL